MQTAERESIKSLTRPQVELFEQDGFLIVREVFSRPEIALLSMECERLLDRKDLIDVKNIRCRWQDHYQTKECRFDAFDPVIDLSPLCAAFARDPRLISILSSIYGEPARLFKDKIIMKPPGAKGYDLHQDFISWKSFPKSFITAAVAIDPSGADNGATEVFAGCHKQGYLSPLDGEYHHLPIEKIDEARGVYLELEPGDVAFFGGCMPHRSGPNRSAGWRRLLYLSYNADSEGGDCRDAHYKEFHTWLPLKYAEYGKHDTYFR
jgi:2-aminoethylphosphonate dioxygenase